MKEQFLDLVRAKARAHPARIVFPETFDERTVQACIRIVEEKLARPVLIGSAQTLKEQFRKAGAVFDKKAYEIIDMQEDTERPLRYIKLLLEIRGGKGLSKDEAEQLLTNLNYYAVMIIAAGDADGLITGATTPSHETLRPALQIISTKEKFHKVSGFFFMVLESRLLLFADCMVNIEPSSEELAEIAIDSAETARRFGIEPKIAMLSFSTDGSAKHPHVDRVREAVKRVNYFRPDLMCEGEMQVDAALVPDVCKRKFPTSKIMGEANVLIFPNLDAANIAYKLVERLAHAQAIGPILQGLRKPINDLSRGCSVDDIVNLAAITAVEAANISL